MIRFLLSNKPITVFLLPLLTIVVWVIGIIFHPDCSSDIFGLQINVTISRILGAAVVLLTAGIINRSVNSQEIFDKTTYLPGALYILAVGYSPEFHCLSILHLANIFLALAIRQLMNIYRQVGCRQQVFNGSFFLMAASLLYPPYLIYMLLPWVALLIFRPFNLKEYLMPLLSVFLFYIWFTSLSLNFYAFFDYFIHYFQNPELQSKSVFHQNISSNHTEHLDKYLYYMKLSLFMVLLNLGVFTLVKVSRNNSLRIKKLTSLITGFLLFSGLLFIIEKYLIDNEHFEQSVSIAFSLLVGVYFYYAKRLWLKSIVFYALLILIVANNYLV